MRTRKSLRGRAPLPVPFRHVGETVLMRTMKLPLVCEQLTAWVERSMRTKNCPLNGAYLPPKYLAGIGNAGPSPSQ